MTKRHAKPTSAQLIARMYRKVLAMDSLLTDTIDANGEALDAINSKLGLLMERVSALNPIVDHCARLLKEKETLQRQVERMNIDGAPTLAAARAAHMTANLPTLNFEMRQYPCGCSATGNGIQPLPDCCPNHYDAPYNNMNSSFEGSPGDGMPKVSSTRQSARALATMELSHKVIDILTPPVPTIYKEAFGTAESPDPVFYACRPDGCTLAHLHRPGIRCGVCGEMPA
jgi:hypothetical protein